MEDFLLVVEELLFEFSSQIGPAKEREASIRYEAWVGASGGIIRGRTATAGKQTQVHLHHQRN